VGALWAGNQWGTIHIPRIGQEVIIEFQEGDPDQPMITGCVYNAQMMPPFKLADNKTKSVIKSNSTLGGAPDEANELTFEDQMGSEDVYFYAQKDSHRVVKNDDDLQVGDAQTISVENSITMTAGTSDTTRQPNGYGGGGMALGGGGLGGGGMGLTKGTIELNAGESITLKVAQSSITITQEGITMTAPMITIGQIGTTTDINIMADTITMSTTVEISELNVMEMNAGETTIMGVPGPYA
jgi:type VI secretion system secreted protein VgrG